MNRTNAHNRNPAVKSMPRTGVRGGRREFSFLGVPAKGGNSDWA